MYLLNQLQVRGPSLIFREGKSPFQKILPRLNETGERQRGRREKRKANLTIFSRDEHLRKSWVLSFSVEA